MNCPGCSAEMTDLSSEGEQVRACPECGGLWSELAELNRLLLHHNLPGVDSLGGRIDREASSPTCPECQIDMICVQSRDRKSGLQYDTCESCGAAILALTGASVRNSGEHLARLTQFGLATSGKPLLDRKREGS